MTTEELDALLAEAKIEHGAINGFPICGPNGELVKAVIRSVAPDVPIGKCRACEAQKRIASLKRTSSVMQWLRSLSASGDAP